MNSKSRWRGLPWLITGLLLLGILGLLLRSPEGTQQVLDQLRADGYPITLEELNELYAQVPPAENAAIILEEAVGVHKRPGDDVPIVGINAQTLKRGEAWSDTSKLAAREFLEANAEVRSRLSIATQKSGCRFPLDLTEGHSVRLPHLAKMKAFAQMLAVEAELAMEEDRPEAVAQPLLDGLIIAEFLNPEPLLISQLVRIASLAIHAKSLERILNRGSINETDLSRLQEGFANVHDATLFPYAMAGEFAGGLSVFHLSTDELSGLMGAFQTAPAATEKVMLWAYGSLGFRAADEAFYVRHMDKVLRSSELDGLKRIEIMREIENDFITGLHTAFRLDRLLSKLLIPALFKATQKEIRIQSLVRLAELSCALERYRAQHDNALPPSLDVLVPEYISAIPEDPWDEKPLRYRRLTDSPGYMLYSVGEHQTDDGGLVRLERVKIDLALIQETWVVTR